MVMPIVPTLETVEFNLGVLIELFRYIVYVWNNTSVLFFGWLYTPFSQILNDTLVDVPLLGDAVGLIAPLFDQIFGPDFSILALISGGFIIICIVMLFLSVVVNWVKLFLPG